MNGKDRSDIANIAYEGVYQALLNMDSLKRIAEYFNGGSISLAFRDCVRKGITELLSICDMDDLIREEVERETDMPNPYNPKGGSI